MKSCPVCIFNSNEENGIEEHRSSALHRFNYLLYQWNEERKKKLVKNRHGVEVSIKRNKLNVNNNSLIKLVVLNNPNNGKHIFKITPKQLQNCDGGLSFICTVKNIKNENIILSGVALLVNNKFSSVHDPQGNLTGTSEIMYPSLEPSAEYDILVKFGNNGDIVHSNYEIPLAFNFQTHQNNIDTFSIFRTIEVVVEDESIIEENLEISPFTNKDWPPDIKVVPSTDDSKIPDIRPIPKKFKRCLMFALKEFNGMTDGDIENLQKLRGYLEPGYPTPDNYAMFWHINLWLEEMGLILMLTKFNMEKVTVKVKFGNLIRLEVPGLAEKRPSVIVGDSIDLMIHNDSSKRAYRGVIKRVHDKTVDIGYVDDELLDYIRDVNPDIEVDVRFVLGRLPLNRMHQGIDNVVNNGIVPSLFPEESRARRKVHQGISVPNGHFLQDLVAENTEQKTAVLKILNGSSFDAPYIVYGPPGTGKTITIVEAIYQLKRKTSKKILVCAPANAACNMLTEKMMQFCGKKELIRILSQNVDIETMSPKMLAYTNYSDSKVQKISGESLKTYRIVVMTLIKAGNYSGQYRPDVLFIDEAAQPCEPEAACAIGLLAKRSQIVLAGDPKQLGPVVASPAASECGLGKSLLERLMELELYDGADENFMTMLKKNFRSHQHILKLPNGWFYGKQLQSVSSAANNDPLAREFVFEKIKGVCRIQKGKKKHQIERNTKRAIEFCSLWSKDIREGNSPSFFNPTEINMVLKYIEALMSLRFDDSEHNVCLSQIGIVTPYVRQVYKLRNLLKDKNFEDVEVGTTETFQGREKRVMIVSTVRAQQDLLLYDKKYRLGFVKDPKRLNVVMTRAKSKLIVIGCSLVLDTDQNWSELMEEAQSNGGFCGVPRIKRDENFRNDITARLNNICLTDAQFQKK